MLLPAYFCFKSIRSPRLKGKFVFKIVGSTLDDSLATEKLT